MTIVGRGLGQPESPLVTGGFGQEDAGLRASLSAVASVTCDLLAVPKQQEGGGRKKRKKELNPLIRVQFGEPKPALEVAPTTAVEQVVTPVQPEITLLPVKKREVKRKQLEEAAKRETDELLRKAAKQVADKKAEEEEEEMMVVMLLSLDE